MLLLVLSVINDQLPSSSFPFRRHLFSSFNFEMTEPIQIVVSFRNQPHHFTLSPDTTLLQLQEQIEVVTSIPVNHQKLIHKSITQAIAQSPTESPTEWHNQTLGSLRITAGTKIMLIGSTSASIQVVHAKDDILAHRQPLPVAKPTSSSSTSSFRINGHATWSEHFTFVQLQILPAPPYPNGDKAHRMLHDLSLDKGIRAIMAKYEWRVGLLTELCPIQRADILGLNQNKGESIALRLRHDDLENFRPYKDVRKVLLHELTHMVHGDHDASFWKLYRHLEKEVLALDWTQQGGHVAGQAGKEFFEATPSSNQGAFQGGTFVLGGDGQRQASVPLRELAAEAAILRLTKEEEEMMHSCGQATKK
jgi:hypothetical protein